MVMTLRTYLKTPGSKSLTELALEIGISKGRLSQLQDAKEWPPALALDVERATGGALIARELSSLVARAQDQAA